MCDGTYVILASGACVRARARGSARAGAQQVCASRARRRPDSRFLHHLAPSGDSQRYPLGAAWSDFRSGPRCTQARGERASAHLAEDLDGRGDAEVECAEVCGVVGRALRDAVRAARFGEHAAEAGRRGLRRDVVLHQEAEPDARYPGAPQ
jgi:hypothetical protein